MRIIIFFGTKIDIRKSRLLRDIDKLKRGYCRQSSFILSQNDVTTNCVSPIPLDE